MKAFEIHTFREGKWKINSVFDDRELAIFDAERMDSSRRYIGVRVIEETFDEDTNETRTRTIYRSTKEGLAELGAKTQSDRKPGKAAQGSGKKSERAVPKGRREKEQKKEKKGLGLLALTLVLCVSGGLAAVIILRMLANAT